MKNLEQLLDEVLFERNFQAISGHERAKLHPPTDLPVKEGGQSARGPSQSTKGSTTVPFRGSQEDGPNKRKSKSRRKDEYEPF